jgi:hypothetical protein
MCVGNNLTVGGSRMVALVRLVTGLLAVVAEALRRGANLSVVADVAALVASTTRERRHFDVCETKVLSREGQICVSAKFVAVGDFEGRERGMA